MNRAARNWKRGTMLALEACCLLGFAACAHALSASVAYQPMVSTGLAAGQPFESWIVLDKPLDPNERGYAIPAGATMRFTFSQAFSPRPEVKPEAVLLYGWSQKAIAVKFTTALDPQDARTIVITLLDPLEAAPPDKPGLKAIHLRTGELNPPRGEHPIGIQFTNAGALTGTATATAAITPAPVPVIAAYNQLHESRNEDWQRVKPGQTAALPIDLLVTLPDKSRSTIALQEATAGLTVVSDGEPIGTIRTRGVPATLKLESFGPGYARLGIVRFRITAGSEPGMAEIDAQLAGGPSYILHLIVESDATGPKASSVSGSAEGEVLGIDRDAGKVTIKHGPIAEFNMPGMTMPFRVKSAGMLDTLQVGDKVRLVAERIDGAYTVTSLERSKQP